MNLPDALPDGWADDIPRLMDTEDLPGLSIVLNSERVNRFRRLDYACRRGHHLAEVLDAPEGRLLVLHGQDQTTPAEGVTEAWQMFKDGGVRRRVRDHVAVLRLADLEPWRTVEVDTTTAVRCRCGRHEFDLVRPFNDLADGIRRVVLPRSRTAQ